MRSSGSPNCLTASVVLYGHAAQEMEQLFLRLSKDIGEGGWAVVDNGGAANAIALARSLGARVLTPGKNLGFGAAHNLALRELAPLGRYHLFVNPDIQMQEGALAQLAAFMDRYPGVGFVMPRILYPDGSEQKLCKRLPAPFDLFARRFLGTLGKSVFRRRYAAYEMEDLDLGVTREVPSLSGCFMFVRSAALEMVGSFDERFFLYMEDFDLCRRIGRRYQTVFYPRVAVQHGYAKGSYSSFRLLGCHLISAIQYFNKWGWFYDPERKQLNRQTKALAE